MAEIAKGRALVLISHTHPLPIYRNVDFSWAFVLEHDGTSADTRLIMRARVAYTPVAPRPIIRSLVPAGFGIGDVVNAESRRAPCLPSSGNQERLGTQREFVRSGR